MSIKSIIFDLDGTLIDSSEGIVASFNYALKMMDMDEQLPERITPYIGYPLETMFSQVAGSFRDELKIHFRDKAIETVVDSSVPLRGANDAVVSLFERGYQLGIASTKIRQHIDGILEKLAWRKYFHSMIGGDEVATVKPEPEQFLSLLKRMNAGEGEALAVGDTVNDVLAAQRSSIPIVAVSSPYGRTKEVKELQPDYFIENITELPDVIEEINSIGVTYR